MSEGVTSSNIVEVKHLTRIFRVGGLELRALDDHVRRFCRDHGSFRIREIHVYESSGLSGSPALRRLPA